MPPLGPPPVPGLGQPGEGRLQEQAAKKLSFELETLIYQIII